MKKLISKLKICKYYLPAVMLGIMIVISISQYDKPEVVAYEIPNKEALETLTSTAKKQQTNKKQTVQTPETNKALSVTNVKENGKYKDGTYQGTANGFGGKITVKVKIKDARFTSIQVVQAKKETPSYFAKAKTVLSRMVQKQSTNVDTVSGATYSSRGLILATRNALAKAQQSGENIKKDTETPAKPKTNSKSKLGKVEENREYKDGTYTGSAEGFGGNITVEVKIADGKIKEIKVKKAVDETPSYLAKAKAVLNQIIRKQSTNVDTVSGATYSSSGLILATRDALAKASIKENTEKPTEATIELPTETTPEENVVENVNTYLITVKCQPEDDEFDEYDMSVTVKVSSGKIVAIEEPKIISNYTKVNERYVNNVAKKMIPEILEKGYEQVDTVSGATCSSKSLINACREAMTKENENK